MKGAFGQGVGRKGELHSGGGGVELEDVNLEGREDCAWHGKKGC